MAARDGGTTATRPAPGTPGSPGALGAPRPSAPHGGAGQAGPFGLAVRLAVLAYQAVVFCFRKLFIQDRATEVAAALTYRTIFSLIPTLVLSLILFRAFVGLGDVSGQLQSKAFEYLGLNNLSVPMAAQHRGDAADAPATSESNEGDASTNVNADPAVRSPEARLPDVETKRRARADAQAELRDNISRIIGSLTEKVSSLNFTSIGGIGVILLIWAAIALVATAEDAFNRIYRSRAGRPWHVRVVVYWGAITLGPLLVWFSIFLTAGLLAWVSNTGYVGTTLMRTVAPFSALMASWLLLFLTYMLVPNARVSPRAALLGSLVGAILWEACKWGFNLYVSIAVPFSALYGTMGLIPLFLVWVHLTWMIVLGGLELTYTVQLIQNGHFEQHRTEELRRQNLCDPTAVVPVMARIAAAFAAGRRIDPHALAVDLGVTVSSLTPVLQRLEREGLVVRVPAKTVEGSERLLPGLPPDQIPVRRLLEVGRGLSTLHPPAAGTALGLWLSRLEEAQASAAGERTLAELVEAVRL